MHPTVKSLAGDNYYHDFEFSAPVNVSWSARILDPHLVDVAGVTVTAAVISTNIVRVTISATETLEMSALEYKPLLRLRDDTIGVTRVEWYLEITK